MSKTFNLLDATRHWLATATNAARKPWAEGCAKSFSKFMEEFPIAERELAAFEKLAADNASLRNQLQALTLEKELLVEALKLLKYGAEKACQNGLNQPQVNGGLVLATTALAQCSKPLKGE